MQFKRQHWVPVGYLKAWNHNGKRNRKARVFKFDGTSANSVKAEKQCCRDFTYSRKQAAIAEKSFHGMENDMPGFVETILSGVGLSRRELMGMLLILTDFHLRNVAHENLTEGDRFSAYKKATKTFIETLLSGTSADDLQQVCDAIAQRWDVSVLRAPGPVLVTSDHPSLLLALTETPNTEIIFALPIDPTKVVIAHCSTSLKVNQQETITAQDVEALNLLQAQQSREAVFLSTRPDTIVSENLRAGFAKRRTDRSAFGPDGPVLHFQTVTSGTFSFLSRG